MACGDLKLAPDNSYVVQFVLKDQDNNPVNDATVTVTITTQDDVEIGGETWPVALDYQAGTDGEYEKSFDSNPNIVDGTIYKIIIDATGTDGTVGQWVNEVKAKTQEG